MKQLESVSARVSFRYFDVVIVGLVKEMNSIEKGHQRKPSGILIQDGIHSFFVMRLFPLSCPEKLPSPVWSLKNHCSNCFPTCNS